MVWSHTERSLLWKVFTVKLKPPQSWCDSQWAPQEQGPSPPAKKQLGIQQPRAISIQPLFIWTSPRSADRRECSGVPVLGLIDCLFEKVGILARHQHPPYKPITACSPMAEMADRSIASGNARCPLRKQHDTCAHANVSAFSPQEFAKTLPFSKQRIYVICGIRQQSDCTADRKNDESTPPSLSAVDVFKSFRLAVMCELWVTHKFFVKQLSKHLSFSLPPENKNCQRTLLFLVWHITNIFHLEYLACCKLSL